MLLNYFRFLVIEGHQLIMGIAFGPEQSSSFAWIDCVHSLASAPSKGTRRGFTR
jgi:hypothetical protein